MSAAMPDDPEAEKLARAILTRRRRKCIAAGDHTDLQSDEHEPARCPRCGL